MLNKEQILQSNDLPVEKVEVPEWGGEVYVRKMTGTERDSFEQSLASSKSKINLYNIRARLCALAICDEKGERLFTDSDVEILGKKSAAALNRIFEVVQKLNGLGAKDVEELENFSGSIPNSVST